MDVVVVDFQVGQVGVGFFVCFQVYQELFGVFVQCLQFVQFCVIVGFDYVIVVDYCWWVVDDCFGQQFGEFGIGVDGGGQCLQVWCFQFGYGVLQVWQCCQCVVQVCQVVRVGVVQVDVGEDVFEVVDFFELWLQVFEVVVFQQVGDGFLVGFQYCVVMQWMVQLVVYQVVGYGGLVVVDY